MKYLNTKLTAVNLNFLIIEAQLPTVISYTVLVKTENCACPHTFVWGKLLKIFLTKNFRPRGETGGLSLC